MHLAQQVVQEAVEPFCPAAHSQAQGHSMLLTGIIGSAEAANVESRAIVVPQAQAREGGGGKRRAAGKPSGGKARSHDLKLRTKRN